MRHVQSESKSNKMQKAQKFLSFIKNIQTCRRCLQARPFYSSTKITFHITRRAVSVTEASIQGVFSQKRSFIQMLDAIYNGIDFDRLEKVGPDRTCAEWLMRCGARVRFKDHADFIEDFNSLPLSGFEKYKIEEIDFTGSTAMDTGFQHLKNLKHVKKIVFNNGKYITSFCIANLIEVKDTLEELEIMNCDQIPAVGLQPLIQLQKLKKLVLFNLPLIKEEQKKSLLDILQEQLPKCHVEFLQDRHKLS